MGKIKEPGKVIWFLVMLIVRIGIVFGVIALIAYGLWALLHALLM
jgi:hypothetical protein